jgi:methionyl-tRNA formyltransferase
MERVVFLGSPAFAVPSLEALAASEFRPTLVVTQPARPAGRGKKLTPTSIHEAAGRLGIPVLVVESFRAAGVLDEIRAAAPDYCVLVSFGKILPQDLLDVAKRGNVNLHPSILPRYRGASPINRAIANGDLFTGLTTMEMVRALDAGPIYLQRLVAIDPMENASELSDRLAAEGAPLVVETLRRISRDGLRPVPQPEEGIVEAPLLSKEDGLIPWERDAVAVHNHIRGMNPWPGSFTYRRGAYLKVHRAEPWDLVPRAEAPGTVLEAAGDMILVACGRGAARLVELQAEGKRAHGAAEFLRGFPFERGEILGRGVDR